MAERLQEAIKNLRYKLAYLIAPDLIYDLENRFSDFLYYQTGGRLSKCNYPLHIMIAEADDFQERCCERCEKERADNAQE